MIEINLDDFVASYILRKDFIFTMNCGSTYIIPKGYSSDGASVPGIFFWWRHGPIHIAGFYHDFAYENGYLLEIKDGIYMCTFFNKNQADKLFYKMLVELNVHKRSAVPMYLAVKLFGRGAFGKNPDERFILDQAV